ncbi:MAG: hypothetical protein V4773_19055 [Verrucomicrobiota bacterium]
MRASFLAVLFLASAGLGHAAASPAVATATPEELAAAALGPVRTWELTGNLRSGFGFKDNILLSSAFTDESALARAEGEIFWWLFPTDRFEALAFANASLTRFFESDVNPREWESFAHGEARWFATPSFQVTAAAEGFHFDQVFDLSEKSAAQRMAAPIAVTGAVGSVAVRWTFLPHTWLELKPSVQRERYREDSVLIFGAGIALAEDPAPNDNTQQSGRATLGRTWREGRIELSLAAQYLRRNYDFRARYELGGRPVFGADLDFEQREGEFTASIVWDQARRWSTKTVLLSGDNRDNGSGYFDYRRRSLRQEVAWKRDPWKVRLTGRAGRYVYDRQTVGVGIDPPARFKEDFLGQVRIERQLTKRLTVYTDYLWERSRSNLDIASYRVNTALLGVDWLF